MAKCIYVRPILELHGKINKTSNISFRGKRTYMMRHPRTQKDFSEHEKAYRKLFGEMNKEASRINHDETIAAAYNDWKENGYTSRYRFILARLIRKADELYPKVENNHI